MPIYLLKCPKCGEVSERYIPYSALKNQRCKKCKTKVESLPAGFTPVFKGKGFYETDYKGKP